MTTNNVLHVQPPCLPHGYEFEFIVCQPDGNLVLPERLDALNRNRPRWLDYEFLKLIRELQSPVFRSFNGIDHFITSSQRQIQEVKNKHHVCLVPFSGIFDPDFMMQKKLITDLPDRRYYLEAWHTMRTQIRESNIYFNKCCGLHISFEISEKDLVRLYNFANVLIVPLTALFSSYGGAGTCLRPLHWMQVDHTVKPLWLDSFSDYDTFTKQLGMPFTTVIPGTTVYKSWPWIRIKPFHNSQKTKKWRLELSMADMTFLPDQISLLSEFVVRLMSIVATQPDFCVKQFDPSALDYLLIQMCTSATDWRSALTLDFESQIVTVQSMIQKICHMVKEVYGTNNATEMVESLLQGEKTGAELIRDMGLRDQSVIRLLAYEQWSATADSMCVAV